MICVDRDGTLIEECDYLADPRNVRLLPGVVPGLKRLQAAGFQVVIISNQSGVARRLLSRRAVERVNTRFVSLLKKKGVSLDGLYWCPHGPAEGCACRKPKLGLVKQAARALKTPWRQSISIGDRWSDVVLGQRTGGKGILVLTGYGHQALKSQGHIHPDHVAKDFNSATKWIIGKRDP